MSDRIKYIFIFIFIFSVFSLTLQASVINYCKESKVFKSQNQTNPVTEEEEESHDSDESAKKEVFLVDHYAFSHTSRNLFKLTWACLKFNYPCHCKTILVPPPRH